MRDRHLLDRDALDVDGAPVREAGDDEPRQAAEGEAIVERRGQELPRLGEKRLLLFLDARVSLVVLHVLRDRLRDADAKAAREDVELVHRQKQPAPLRQSEDAVAEDAVLAHEGLQIVPELPALLAVLARGGARLDRVLAQAHPIRRLELGDDLVEESRNVIDQDRTGRARRSEIFAPHTFDELRNDDVALVSKKAREIRLGQRRLPCARRAEGTSCTDGSTPNTARFRRRSTKGAGANRHVRRGCHGGSPPGARPKSYSYFEASPALASGTALSGSGNVAPSIPPSYSGSGAHNPAWFTMLQLHVPLSQAQT